MREPERVEVKELPGVGVFKYEGGRLTLRALGTPLLYMTAALYEVMDALVRHEHRRVVLN